MISYHDILKAFRGEHTENVHALLWGKKIEKNQIQEISGIPPLTFKSYADYLTDYRVYGNTAQNGTPSPEAPVDVVGCGVRTENLFNKENSSMRYYGYINSVTGKVIISTAGSLSIIVSVKPNSNYTISKLATTRFRVGLFTNYPVENSVATDLYGDRDGGGIDSGTTLSFSTSANTAYIMAFIRNYNDTATSEEMLSSVMVNEGSTALPYEPYGYKIPVTVSDGTSSITTPVYIGTEPLHKIGDYADYVDFKRGVVVRRIKKLVIRGDETGLFNLTGGFSACRIMVNVLPNTYCFSSHFFSYSPVFSYFDVLENSISVAGTSSNIYANGLFDSVASIRDFFSNQYSAGTPVTVWYVLAEPEEEPLESLLPIQTIRGTNVLTADTTVQPSEMYIKGKIKEVNQNE